MIKGLLIDQATAKGALLIGLSEANFARLRKGEPIQFELGELTPAVANRITSVVIVWGPTEEQIEADLARLFEIKEGDPPG